MLIGHQDPNPPDYCTIAFAWGSDSSAAAASAAAASAAGRHLPPLPPPPLPPPPLPSPACLSRPVCSLLSSLLSSVFSSVFYLLPPASASPPLLSLSSLLTSRSSLLLPLLPLLPPLHPSLSVLAALCSLLTSAFGSTPALRSPPSIDEPQPLGQQAVTAGGWGACRDAPEPRTRVAGARRWQCHARGRW